MSVCASSLTILPDELIEMIASYRLYDKISLSYTCKRFYKLLSPRHVVVDIKNIREVIPDHLTNQITVDCRESTLYLDGVNPILCTCLSLSIRHLKMSGLYNRINRFKNLHTLDIPTVGLISTGSAPNCRYFEYYTVCGLSTVNSINAIKSLHTLRIMTIDNVEFKYIKTLYINGMVHGEYTVSRLPKSDSLKNIYTKGALIMYGFTKCVVTYIGDRKESSWIDIRTNYPSQIKTIGFKDVHPNREPMIFYT